MSMHRPLAITNGHRIPGDEPVDRDPDSDLGEAEALLHRAVIRDLDETALRGLDPEQARDRVERATRHIATSTLPRLVGDAKELVVAHVVDEVTGFGPLEPLLRNKAISEVMVNSPTEVYYEREGRLYRSSVAFRDEAHVMRIVQRIIAPIGRRVDEASPMVDARLPDGSRVNVIIPPLAPKGAAITIRKFRVDRLSLGDLVQAGSLSEDMGTLLAGCVRAKLNMVVSGGAGSGKTTLLNALTAFMGESERIVTVEDPVELRVQRQHVIQLEVRPPSLEGTGEVSQRDLVRNCLRMRPDRIIVGEVRGAEAFDMLQAMNTGHEGSLTTAHANAPRDALARIENMVLMAGFDIGLTAVRSQIASALNVIVHVSRLSDGSRKVVRITEVAGMEGNVVSLQDIFAFKQTGVSSAGHVEGSLRPTGIRPRFLERLSAFGVNLSESMFKTKGDS